MNHFNNKIDFAEYNKWYSVIFPFAKMRMPDTVCYNLLKDAAEKGKYVFIQEHPYHGGFYVKIRTNNQGISIDNMTNLSPNLLVKLEALRCIYNILKV